MTYDHWKTTEPEPEYVPDEEPPEEMGEPDEQDFLVHRLGTVIAECDMLDLDASITLTLTADDGSVVTVTRESAKRMGRRM